MVQPVTKQLLNKSANWHYPAPLIVRKTPREMLMDFRSKHCGVVTLETLGDIDELIEKAQGWYA
jgi:hypothetical protein